MSLSLNNDYVLELETILYIIPSNNYTPFVVHTTSVKNIVIHMY